MVNVLLKKQLFEIFRSYFYDAKKNRPRSRASTILFFVLYAVLMIGFVGGMFVLLAWSLCQPLVASGMGWLYFTLFAGLAILLGVFGSVFNTFSSLYQAKDNDLLLSMPIPIRAILASRLLGVYLMGLMFSGVVLLPAVIFYWCAADASPSAIAGGVMLVLAVSLFVLVLSCVLGWAVAKISAKLKHKNFLTVFIALVFFGLYYAVCFRASDLLNELLANLTAVGDAVRGAAYPLYLLGRMGEGDWLAIAFVMAVTLALCALTYLVLSRTFIGIATASGTTAKAEYREKAVKAAGASSALLRKEFGRFTSSPNYMLNCALGTVMLPIMGVLLLVKAGELLPVVYEIAGGEAPGFLAVMLCAALCLIGSMNDTAASSVSLEGKNLWLAQSLPVTAAAAPRQAAGAAAGDGHPHGGHLRAGAAGYPSRSAGGRAAGGAAAAVRVAVGGVRPADGSEAPQSGLDKRDHGHQAAYHGAAGDAGRVAVRRRHRRAVLRGRRRYGRGVVPAGVVGADGDAGCPAAPVAAPQRKPTVRPPGIRKHTP